MKQQRSFPAFKVSKRCENRLKGGHPWVYDNEIEVSDEGVENGCIADVLSPKGSYLGSGLVSLNSKIRVRILSDNANETFGESFFRRRIRYALDHRKTVMGDDISACRLVHGESDGLPGLTVDRYNDILSVQVLSYGMEQRKDMLYRLLFIAENAPDLYGCLMVTGIFSHIALQVVLNICVVLGILPTTGVTLPFISYGGTSVLFLMMEIAIALSVSRLIRSKKATKDLWGNVVRYS